MSISYIKVPDEDAPTSLYYVEPELIKAPECPDPLTARPCYLSKDSKERYAFDLLPCDGEPFKPGEWLSYDDAMSLIKEDSDV